MQRLLYDAESDLEEKLSYNVKLSCIFLVQIDNLKISRQTASDKFFNIQLDYIFLLTNSLIEFRVDALFQQNVFSTTATSDLKIFHTTFTPMFFGYQSLFLNWKLQFDQGTKTGA